MTVLCLSNQPQPQQMALSDTRFQRAGLCCTARRNHITEPVAPSIAGHDISRFLSLGLTEEESVQEKKTRSIEALKDDIRLNITHTEKDVLRRTVDRQHATLGSDVSSGGRRSF
jgi:hypothetical protein